MTVDPKWIRGPADVLAAEEGCYFDQAAADHACGFVETFCCQSKGKWAGKPIALLAWQRDFLSRLFGWKRADGTRRYRRAYLEVAKKNGKSTLVSALTLYLLVADGEGAPEVYTNAYDRAQASIVFDEAARMVRASKSLAKRLQVIDSKKRIVCPGNNGTLIANSSVVDSKDGLNPSGVIFDELHRQPGRELFDVFEYGSAARSQPINIAITTAGEDEYGIWHEQREYSEKVNTGAIPDTAYLGVVYRVDPEKDDLDDPATWRKANPSLGETIDPDEFAREFAKAKEVPVKLANFLRLRLNIITRGEGKFVDPAEWDACSAPPAPLAGESFWAGGDLSTTTDLTAVVALSGDADGGFDVHCRFYLPEDNILDLEKRDRVPYGLWARQGHITLTPGNVIDYGFVRRDVNDLAAEGDCRKIAFDPYNAAKLAGELQEQDGLPVEYIRQGFLSLSAPTKELARLIRSGKLRHGGNPVLRWMAGNAVAETDAAGNIKLSKKKSRLKIDGMSALVNAVAAATSGDEDGPSVYDSRGALVLGDDE